MCPFTELILDRVDLLDNLPYHRQHRISDELCLLAQLFHVHLLPPAVLDDLICSLLRYYAEFRLRSSQRRFELQIVARPRLV